MTSDCLRLRLSVLEFRLSMLINLVHFDKIIDAIFIARAVPEQQDHRFLELSSYIEFISNRNCWYRLTYIGDMYFFSPWLEWNWIQKSGSVIEFICKRNVFQFNETYRGPAVSSKHFRFHHSGNCLESNFQYLWL